MTVSHIEKLSAPENAAAQILFLGYDRDHTRLIDALIDAGCEVHYTKEKITEHDCTADNFDLVISFNYRHIIKKAVLDTIECPIINLHVSYLPYNKGAHPYFWSFFDNTPSGVTIHLIDAGIDTGSIHYLKDLPDDFSGWDSLIADEIERLRKKQSVEGE